MSMTRTLASGREWRDLNGKLIRRPGRMAIAIAAYGNHLHIEAGGAPDFAGCMASLMDFRSGLYRQRFRSNNSALLLWLLDLVGGSMPVNELEIATENSNLFDDILLAAKLDGLIEVTSGAVVLTEKGRSLTAKPQ